MARKRRESSDEKPLKEHGNWVPNTHRIFNSLEDVQHDKFAEQVVRHWTAQICMALDCLHKNNVFYRDLKNVKKKKK
jgi:serine/threonine protein kinase